MENDLGPCKLDKLATEFSPGRITLHIELVPQEGEQFDTPMTEPGKKLGMIANYARGIFQVNLKQRKLVNLKEDLEKRRMMPAQETETAPLGPSTPPTIGKRKVNSTP